VKLIIRDDDISAATDPSMLEKVYGRLWEAGFPVCFSTIPIQSCDVLIQYMTPYVEYDFNIPPPLRGSRKKIHVQNNKELVDYLKKKLAENKVELVLHGLNHNRDEFVSSNQPLLDRKIKKGKSVLQDVFDVQIKTFVAPFDAISPAGIDAVFANDLNLCAHSGRLKAHKDLLPIFKNKTNVAIVGDTRRTIFIADESLFDPIKKPSESAMLAIKRIKETPEDGLIVLTNHYWCFFDDWGPPNKDWFNNWNKFLDQLLSISDVKLTTFASWDKNQHQLFS
jgi:hypothetical protein